MNILFVYAWNKEKTVNWFIIFIKCIFSDEWQWVEFRRGVYGVNDWATLNIFVPCLDL